MKEIQVIREFDFFSPVSLECDINKKRKRKGKKNRRHHEQKKRPHLLIGAFETKHISLSAGWIPSLYRILFFHSIYIRRSLHSYLLKICWRNSAQVSAQKENKEKFSDNGFRQWPLRLPKPCMPNHPRERTMGCSLGERGLTHLIPRHWHILFPLLHRTWYFFLFF